MDRHKTKGVFGMRELNLNVVETVGYAVMVEVEGNINEYAESFLHIFNNVRANEGLLKVKNHYNSNDVTVYCELDSKEALVKYLKMFGKIKSCEKVLMYQMEEPEYDFDKYDEAIVIPEFN